MIMDSNGSGISGTISDDGDDLFEEMGKLRRRQRVFCLMLAQLNDSKAQDLVEVWKEVFSDVFFLEEVAYEFERKDAEEQTKLFDARCMTRRVCESAPHLRPSPLSYYF